MCSHWIRQIRLTKPLCLLLGHLVLLDHSSLLYQIKLFKSIAAEGIVQFSEEVLPQYGTYQIKIAYAYASCLVSNM